MTPRLRSPRHRTARHRTTAARIAGALVVAVTLTTVPAGAATSASRPGNEERQIRALQTQRAQVQAKKARSAAKVNALKATTSQIQNALSDLSNHVSATSARLEDAQRAADAADAQVAAAVAAEQAAEARLGDLRDAIRRQAIDAYVAGSPDDTWSIYSAGSASDATNRRTLLEFRSSRNLAALEDYRTIQHDLAVTRQSANDAAARAKRHRADVDAQLSELRQAQQEQQKFAAQVDDRISAELAEADALSTVDSALSGQIVAQQSALAKRVAAVSRTRSSGGGGGTARTFATSGGSGIVTVGGIRVAASIAGNVEALLNAAAAAGIQLGGGGYRDPAGQVAVRRSNCGSSNYAVYEMPASSCHPPTARPGTSMHEQGLAIDFTQGGRTISRGSSAFAWLQANAARFGLHNLPSEPWHWSTNGN